MEKEAILPTDVATSKDLALILYAAKQRMLSAERIRTPTATRLIMNPSWARLAAHVRQPTPPVDNFEISTGPQAWRLLNA
jgi:hypothetical protein